LSADRRLGREEISKGLALFDRERANIEAGQAWAATHAKTDDEAARLCSEYPDWGTQVISLRIHPREQIAWRKAALDAAGRLKDRAAEGRHLGNLGNAYCSLGKYRRTIEYHEKSLAIAREIGDRQGEGHVLDTMGTAYYSLGDYRRAIEYYEKHLAIAREMGDRPGEALALGNMSLALWRLDKKSEAISRAEASLKIHEEIEDPWAGKVREGLEQWRKECPPAGN